MKLLDPIEGIKTAIACPPFQFAFAFSSFMTLLSWWESIVIEDENIKVHMDALESIALQLWLGHLVFCALWLIPKLGLT